MTWLKYQWSKEEVVEYLTRKYAGKTTPSRDGACTRLVKDEKTGKLQRNQLPSLVKTVPLSADLFSLNAWLRRAGKFRKQYNQTFTDYAWALYAQMVE